ncbi:MAG: ribonuclease R [Clostridia bacterium]|nr:ribonuclease R [Clostridia bacterium]
MTREELLVIMRQSTYKPLTAQELVEELQIEDIASFLALLRELEAEGEIILTRKQKYGLPERMGLVSGRIQGHVKGFAFLLPSLPGHPDVYIAQEDLNGALHNDRVVVRLHPPKGRGTRPEGEVIRILRRANETVVGTLDRGKKYGFVIPDDKRLATDIFIAAEDMGNARHGDKVVVAVTRWPEGRRSPEGKIIEVLGQAMSPGVDVLSIVRKYGLPEDFPPEVLAEAASLPDVVLPGEHEERLDLRDVKTVTIDGADAKDLDDAISIEKTGEHSWRLMVHIADVGYYVKEGSALDREAFNRGTSVYLVDRVIPMLPPKLSIGICSLNAGVERLAMTVIMEVNAVGKVTGYEITPSVIQVDRRMTYDEVRKILEEKPPELMAEYRDFVPEFRMMAELARCLYERRMRRGAVDFNLPEYKVILDDRGKPVAIEKRSRTIAESIIEEFMLLANETVSEHMYWLEAPFVYRIHEDPDLDSVEELNDFLHNLGYHVKVSDGEVSPWAFQEVLRKVQGQPEEKVVNTVMLRSMKHAGYSPESLGHFGLAAQYYCHFTAPIRRYPDLVIHRIIREYLKGKPAEKRLQALARQTPLWAEQSSIREKAAEEAERESVALKMVEYMERHLGDVFTGTISGVTSFGLFVELENGVEGLVHISTLTDDYYIYQEKQLALLGQHTRKMYRLGDRVTVLVVRVNTEERQIDFEVVDEGYEPR